VEEGKRSVCVVWLRRLGKQLQRRCWPLGNGQIISRRAGMSNVPTGPNLGRHSLQAWRMQNERFVIVALREKRSIVSVIRRAPGRGHGLLIPTRLSQGRRYNGLVVGTPKVIRPVYDRLPRQSSGSLHVEIVEPFAGGRGEIG
jgi:hypothetical protein